MRSAHAQGDIANRVSCSSKQGQNHTIPMRPLLRTGEVHLQHMLS